MNLDEIYTQLVMEHSRNSENRRSLGLPGAIKERGLNPSCGDDIEIEALIKDGILEDIAFTGEGCAISLASTSLMIDLLKGGTTEKAREFIELFLGMIKREITDEEELMKLGDAYAFANISNMPSRVKCATLAWHTILEIINK